ncbi:helix-turn-helix domain-containing protein [Candidatus Lucifugimonas marina]|uniref:Helix-turn-helix domain-containing protein n=1 Tax=Candidatus Lucifugimonas marina TaxID=3038979 RepID=A0AAJ6CVI2_9CHLR|nr:helix-turn-helix domain-containing protein [SAR202 cluster bacterium JH702]MDG0870159.1 helix-turn-helix domain-containing protein [SAR202 cluster bacterium JH639]WFG36286.1 helix-turn-helix domain-containing protein [SAR202 cluster bacterium JH545]WFG40219.1 helix-turn-helix domain-containing protein [SAR202 cluster bacterium JH1073]
MSLSVRDVAVRLNVSEKTVYKWLKNGLIPASRIGKSWIITEESVKGLIEPTVTVAPVAASRYSPGAVMPVAADPSVVTVASLEQNQEAGYLTKFTNVLTGAVSHGVQGILGPRGSDPATSATIATALENAYDEVILQGIGLREFFGDRGHTAILKQMAAEDRAVQIRAILVNPVSEFARARAVAEDGAQFEDEDRFKAGPLYNDSWRSLNVIAAMKKDAESRDHFGIDVRFVDHWPSVYLVMTSESTFIETYHFGKPNAAVDGSSIDGLVPMFQFDSSSSYAAILRQHFDYIWSGANPHVKTYSLADIADAMQVDV